MDVLDNILNFEEDIHLLREEDIETGQHVDIPEINPVQPAQNEKQLKCDHNRVLGDPQNGAICLECDCHMTRKETKDLDYRQFGLLFCN